MALEVRLQDDARVTKDIDLGPRDDIGDADGDGDGFVLAAGPPARLGEDGGAHVTWRVKVAARLAGKPFGGVQLDVSPRAHELGDTDRVALSNSLDFAGIPTPVGDRRCLSPRRREAPRDAARLRRP